MDPLGCEQTMHKGPLLATWMCNRRWEWLESGAGAPVLVAASLPPKKTGPWVTTLLVTLDSL